MIKNFSLLELSAKSPKKSFHTMKNNHKLFYLKKNEKKKSCFEKKKTISINYSKTIQQLKFMMQQRMQRRNINSFVNKQNKSEDIRQSFLNSYFKHSSKHRLSFNQKRLFFRSEEKDKKNVVVTKKQLKRNENFKNQLKKSKEKIDLTKQRQQKQDSIRCLKQQINSNTDNDRKKKLDQKFTKSITTKLLLNCDSTKKNILDFSNLQPWERQQDTEQYNFLSK